MMDPNETLALLLESVAEHDTDTLLTHAADLVTWYVKAGFSPRISDELTQAAKLHSNDLFCHELRALVEKHR